MSYIYSCVQCSIQADALTQQFGDLQGKHRELKLAAAHIDDALNGRFVISFQQHLVKCFSKMFLAQKRTHNRLAFY
jgi:hypothetical protein